MVYLATFLLALGTTLIITPFVRRFANSVGLMDKPGPRRVHTKPTARGGGLAVFFGFWLVLGATLLFAPDQLRFIERQVFGIDQNLIGVFLGGAILLAVGLWDDYRPLRPGVKLIWHFVAAIMPVLFGIRIWWFSHPFGGPNIVLGSWSNLIVPLWLVLMINVMNWLDGIDGLATGIAGIASVILLALSLTSFVNQPATALMAATLAGATFGFLPYNFHPAKIFLGDSGSQFLGYMIGIFAIISGGKVATASLVLGIPILDALWVIARRIASRQSPFKADRRHLHHRFLDIGLSQRQTVLVYYLIALLFGMIALGTKTYGKLVAGMWLVALMVVIAMSLVLGSYIQSRRGTHG
ncbi:undecaprenyl/decaprenyl-phosphate alpha-N-acetylglucosaminyl 1-phosphate transferase [Candidatus Berkelbacteria bacterium]|nr:undecaprenyl/decaprenyl-phosphate alpha-N-acetylglucosaminyl 1-phosphate transferase [Candidatus Berkelbacteria bacterium]